MTSAATWIVDSSPLIVLAKVDYLPLLAEPGRRVLYTETVAREVEAGEENDPARRALAAGWGECLADVSVPRALSNWMLDAGEQTTLALALANPGSLAVLDDGEGRRAAQALGVFFTGTIGVLLQARQRGRIPAMAPVLHALRDAGLFLPSDSALRSVLATVGEAWP